MKSVWKKLDICYRVIEREREREKESKIRECAFVVSK